MHGSVYTVDKPLNTVDEYHYYKTCSRLQDATRRPREHDEDETDGLEECEDCQERREYNKRQRIGLSGPARNLVEADPEDYPLKTDGGRRDKDCDGCGVSRESDPLRSILLVDGERELLCEGCFEDALEEQIVSSLDARLPGENA